MPAAAVIPAPLAYIKVVAVKKLVVEFWTGSCGTGPLKVGSSASVVSGWSQLQLGVRCFVT